MNREQKEAYCQNLSKAIVSRYAGTFARLEIEPNWGIVDVPVYSAVCGDHFREKPQVLEYPYNRTLTLIRHRTGYTGGWPAFDWSPKCP